MTLILITNKDEARVRGTFGYIVNFDGPETARQALVKHVFADGRLLVHYAGHKHFAAICDAQDFVPSRDAYFTEGSYLEPEWEGDTARCTNWWDADYQPDPSKKIDWNGSGNVKTDTEALAGFSYVDVTELLADKDANDALVAAKPYPQWSRRVFDPTMTSEQYQSMLVQLYSRIIEAEDKLRSLKDDRAFYLYASEHHAAENSTATPNTGLVVRDKIEPDAYDRGLVELPRWEDPLVLDNEVVPD